MNVTERRVTFEQVFNFRDLGGYPTDDGRSVRWRRLYRADGLNRLQPEEEEKFAQLGIATVIDLRTVDEAEHGGRFPTHVWDVTYHHLPMFDVLPDWPPEVADPAEYLSERYIEMFASGRRSIATTLQLLGGEDSYPLVFHCAAGKDRTGILAALVLKILGVEDDVIAGDYALSHEAMERLMAWARQQEGVFARPRNPVPAVAVGARPETMVAFLRKIGERSDGVDGFLSDLGLEPALAVQIRDLLLEAA